MLNQALISAPAPPLHSTDTVARALDLFNEMKVENWPVVDDGVFKGLISEGILLDSDGGTLLSDLQYEFLPFSVESDEFFLSAVRLMTSRKLDVVAVTSPEKEYKGVIVQSDLLQCLAMFSGAEEQGGIIVFEMAYTDFAPGEISRLIETNNAQIRQLNTRFDDATGLLRVVVRINRQEISDIIATFQRYDFRITYFAGEEQFENELRRNYHHLMHFMEM